MKETANHPEHYGGDDNPYEEIKVIEAWDLNFCLGNAAKYAERARRDASRILMDKLGSAATNIIAGCHRDIFGSGRTF